MNVVPLTTGLVSSSLTHIAIIMDGNGRWAKLRGLPRQEGHRRGLEALIDRKSFYRLVAAAVPDADGRLVLRSQGAVFALEG